MEKRNTGQHMTRGQINVLKNFSDRPVQEIRDEYGDLFTGITDSNIQGHQLIWKRFPEDSYEDHMKHYSDAKKGRAREKTVLQPLDRGELKDGLIVSWPFRGEIATGIIDRAGWVVVAINYRMDAQVSPDDLWYNDTLYTEFEPHLNTDWSKVRLATLEERIHLFTHLPNLECVFKSANDYMNEFAWITQEIAQAKVERQLIMSQVQDIHEVLKQFK